MRQAAHPQRLPTPLRTRRAIRGGLAVVLAAGFALAGGLVTSLGGASPAAAADDSGVQLSSDGVHWSGSLSGNVLPLGQTLVPGDTLDGRFYVKNDRSEPAYLRVGLSDLTVTDWSLAQALTLTLTGTTSAGASGSSAAFSGSGIVCSDLLRRDQPIAPGAIVLVSASLRFRSTTSGTDAQGALASLGFIAELSDIDLNATGTPMCDGQIAVGPVDPGSGGSGDGGGSSGNGGGGSDGSGTDGAGGSTDSTGVRSGSGSDTGAGATATPPDIGTAPGRIGFADGGGQALVAPANTMRLYEEYAILVLLCAALAGMLLRLGAQRRWERMVAELMKGNDE